MGYSSLPSSSFNLQKNMSGTIYEFDSVEIIYENDLNYLSVYISPQLHYEMDGEPVTLENGLKATFSEDKEFSSYQLVWNMNDLWYQIDLSNENHKYTKKDLFTIANFFVDYHPESE